MKQSVKHLAAALALCLPFAAGAHDVWVVPSSTVLSGADSWITWTPPSATTSSTSTTRRCAWTDWP